MKMFKIYNAALIGFFFIFTIMAVKSQESLSNDDKKEVKNLFIL